MLIPTHAQIKAAHATIVARGDMSLETRALTLLIARDPILNAIIDSHYQIISGTEFEENHVKAVIVSILMVGLNIGLTAASNSEAEVTPKPN